MQEPGAPALRSTASFRLAAVVPTWNEEAHIEQALESLRRGGVDEVVVVDGGSTDGTVGRAAALADMVLEERGGLFRQLNQGGRRAGGAVLLLTALGSLWPAGRAGRSDPADVLRE